MGSGIELAQSWDGTDDAQPPNVLASGRYDYTLTSSQSGGGGAATDVRGWVELDSTLDIARIDLPTERSVTVDNSLDIEGTVGGSGSPSYQLEYAPGYAPTSGFLLIDSGTGPASGVLGSWNTTSLTAGIYTLRLIVGSGPQQAEDRVTVGVFRVDPLVSSSAVFSPNGDGKLDWVAVETSATLDTEWILDVIDSTQGIVHQIEGEGREIAAFWEGEAGAGLAPEDDYTFRLTATEPGAQENLVVSGGLVNLDTTPPFASIAAPGPGEMVLGYGPLSVVGDATDLNADRYFLSWAPGQSPVSFTEFDQGSGAVSGGLLGELPEDEPSVPEYPNGIATLRLDVVDRGENASVATREIDFDRISISNVTLSPELIDALAGESTQITYDLSHPADIGLTLHPSGGTQVVKSLLSDDPQAAGTNGVAWDGTTDSGSPAASGAYFVSIAASDAFGRTATLNPPGKPVLRTGLFTPLETTFTPSSISFDAYKNEDLQIDAGAQEPGFRRIVVFPTSGGQFTAVESAPVPAGVSTFTWNGRVPATGEILQETFNILVSDSGPDELGNFVERDSVLVRAPTLVPRLHVNPYVFIPMYSQVSDIRFELSRSARVTLDLYDPNGGFLVSLLDAVELTAGEHTYPWDGRDVTDRIVVEEGLHEVRLTAEDLATGETAVRTGALTVFY